MLVFCSALVPLRWRYILACPFIHDAKCRNGTKSSWKASHRCSRHFKLRLLDSLANIVSCVVKSSREANAIASRCFRNSAVSQLEAKENRPSGSSAVIRGPCRRSYIRSWAGRCGVLYLSSRRCQALVRASSADASCCNIVIGFSASLAPPVVRWRMRSSIW